ncbi:hypothetical protein STCU_07787 [Strigomonas culicis]|uniref:Uncharacterized protein n=1 Tax=Strigomonas culicis TaxID=28005 RepID=S9TXN9_9TRYP|nr:hypothetical protein STCU_07787 [Strigomonas culicis]|eukprot:EPY23272.1 hypothetical protein STCU_07787 [Strigomonas culicis]
MLSISDALLHYEQPEKAFVMPNQRQLLFENNVYFSIDFVSEEESFLDDLRYTGLHAAKRVNGFHVLLCQERVLFVDHERQCSFPPFTSKVSDAYIEIIAGELAIVCIATMTGVCVALVKLGSPATVVQSIFVETHKPAVRIHRLKKDIFTVCFADCSVQNMNFVVDKDEHHLPRLLRVFVQEQARAATRSGVYRDSILNVHHGQLLMLSNTKLVCWSLEVDGVPRQQAELAVPAEAVSLLLADQESLMGLVVFRNGARAHVVLQPPASPARPPQLALCNYVQLPLTLPLTNVAHACEGAGPLILFDASSLALVVSNPNGSSTELPCMDDSVPPNTPIEAVSVVHVDAVVTGISFEHINASRGDGVFWVYGTHRIVAIVTCLSKAHVLSDTITAVPSKVHAFAALSPRECADFLSDLLLAGYPVERVGAMWEPLLAPQPTAGDATAYTLSPAAQSLTVHLLQRIGLLGQLWRSFHYFGLARDLLHQQKGLLRAAHTARAALQRCRGSWLSYPAKSTLIWSGSAPLVMRAAAGAGRPLSLVGAINGQAEFLDSLLASVEHAAMLCHLYSLQLDHSAAAPHPPCALEEAVWTRDPAELENELCMALLLLERVEVTEVLHTFTTLPRRAACAVRFHILYVRGLYADALAFAEANIELLVAERLLQHVVASLEARAPDLLPTLRLLLCYYHADPTVQQSVIRVLEELTNVRLLKQSLECVFQAEGMGSLQDYVLDWMESLPLDDFRIETCAEVISELNIQVDPAHNITGSFFSCWKERRRGDAAAAARRFGQLALTRQPATIDVRLKCLEQAVRHETPERYLYVHFTLLLQRKLCSLVEEFVEGGGAAHAAVEEDLEALRLRCLDEKELFIIAGRYYELGGAILQLDLLRKHTNAPESLTSKALVGALLFMKATGHTAESAASRLLEEHWATFQSPLPLLPFIEFFASQKLLLSQTTGLFLTHGVPIMTVFETVFGLLEGHPQFPAVDVMAELVGLVEAMEDAPQRQVCVAHLLERLHAMMDGEGRSAPLPPKAISVLAALEAKLRDSKLPRAVAAGTSHLASVRA